MNTTIIIVFHSSFSLAGMVTNISLVAEREGEGDGESRDRSETETQKRGPERQRHLVHMF